VIHSRVRKLPLHGFHNEDRLSRIQLDVMIHDRLSAGFYSYKRVKRIPSETYA
jgi:hypothetical protein